MTVSGGSGYRRRQPPTSVSAEVHEILFERRLLTLVTALAGLGVVGWLVAVATDYWIIVVAAEEGGKEMRDGTTAFLWSYSGLWKCCAIYKAGARRLYATA